MTAIPPESRAWLSELAADPAKAAIAAPCLDRQLRVDVRNAVLRLALKRFYVGQRETVAAKAMAAEMAAGPSGTPRGAAVAAILALNDGRPIGWRQIVNIADGLQ